MKRFILLIILAASQSTWAERMGVSTSGFLNEPPIIQSSPGPTPPAAPAAPRPRVAQSGPATVADTAAAPTAKPACVPPIKERPYRTGDSPYQSDTDLRVVVDQQRQVMTVYSPDFQQPLEIPVSTGGGLKIPKPEDGEPYYACTPEMKDKIITGFEAHEFTGRQDCKPEDVRYRTTMYPGDTYRSGNFKTEDGEGVSMPNALRIMGGIFIHRVPESYKKLLGHAVSGECVRVPGWHSAPDWIQHQPTINEQAMTVRTRTLRSGRKERVMEVSETLYKQMKRHGAIKVTVTAPPHAVCHLPKEERRRKALADAGREQGTTGTEGVIGGVSNFFNNLAALFGGGGVRPQPRPSVGQDTQPQAPAAPAPRAQRRRVGDDPSWQERAFSSGN